jgi:hypothetical protein
MRLRVSRATSGMAFALRLSKRFSKLLRVTSLSIALKKATRQKLLHFFHRAATYLFNNMKKAVKRSAFVQ